MNSGVIPKVTTRAVLHDEKQQTRAAGPSDNGFEVALD
jgi:hypothetical protein